MQYYLNGYKFGDPEVHAAAPGFETPSKDLPETVDVLIVGTGPAGVVLAAQLSSFSGFTTCIVERRNGPLELGQADGVSSRSVEMMAAFGLSTKLIQEACWIRETVFWRPDPQNRMHITRTGRIDDAANDLSEMPHLIVNQARLQQYLLDYMEKSPTRLTPNYGFEAVDTPSPLLLNLQQMARSVRYGPSMWWAPMAHAVRSVVQLGVTYMVMLPIMLGV